MPLPKNFRNYQAYLAKKKRGPIKAFFHITKNENVPAIEQQGLLANHPNANINSAFQPFRKHGSKGGGVWVTTEPSAFPVYGTTIGGKFDDGSARADALSTFKIEVPVPELPKMLAVQDPYGKNILRKGNDPRAIEPFGTWLGNDVPTTVFLNDMKPEWLKNLGYVEERAAIHPILDTRSDINELRGSWGISPDNEDAVRLRHLSKGDLRDYSGLTGHGHGFGTYDKSPQRFVEDYINWNRPITHRLPIFPKPDNVDKMARIQGATDGPKYIKMSTRRDVLEPNEIKRYSANFIPEFKWTYKYRDYVKPGESGQDRRSYKFGPGAISRGMGGRGLPPIKARHFDWNQYNELLSAGVTPQAAAFAAQPSAKLDWDNIVLHDIGGYQPSTIPAGHSFNAVSAGAVSRGLNPARIAEADVYKELRGSNADRLRRAIAPYNRSNADIIRDQFKFDMPDDEIRELSRLEIRNNKDNVPFSEAVQTWSRLENSDILKRRQRALNKIKGSWLYDYLTKKR